MAEQYQIRGDTAADIVTSIETGVRTGSLAPGAALPTVRGLAAALSLATATVAAAYRTLRQRGIIETAGRHGTHVRHRPPLTHRGPAASLPTGILNLAGGEPDPALLPDLHTALTQVHPAPGGYSDAGLCPALLDLARARFHADGVTGDITVTGGALDGIDRVLSAHLEPGDSVGIEDPTWANLRDLIAALGMHAVPVPVDDQGPTVEGIAAAIRAGAKAIVITSRAQNPTGIDITAARAGELRRELRRHPHILVIEDDHWGELSTHPLYFVADAVNHWIFLRSVSKPYGPDLRLAMAAGDETSIARLEGRMRIGSGWVSTVLQQIVVALMSHPDTHATIERASRTYRDKQQDLIAALSGHHIPATGTSGLNVWIPVADETSAVTTLRDNGYAVAPGAPSRIHTPPAIRVTIAALPRDRIRHLAATIAAVPHTTTSPA